MKNPVLIVLVMLFCSVAQGCATAKGIKQDFKSVIGAFKGQDNKVKQADDWVKENLW